MNNQSGYWPVILCSMLGKTNKHQHIEVSTVLRERPGAPLSAAALLQQLKVEQLKVEQAPASTPRSWWPRATPLWPWAGWRFETMAPTSAPSAWAPSMPSRSSSSTSSVSPGWFARSVIWRCCRSSFTLTSPASFFLFGFQSRLVFLSRRRSWSTMTNHLSCWAATAPNTFPWMFRSVFQLLLSPSFQPLQDLKILWVTFVAECFFVFDRSKDVNVLHFFCISVVIFCGDAVASPTRFGHSVLILLTNKNQVLKTLCFIKVEWSVVVFSN